MINDTNHCHLSAGHCGTDSVGSGVLEYNVPLSNNRGGIVHPPPEDQFSIDRLSVQRVDGGVGNDWQYMGAFENSNTGLSSWEHGGRVQYNLASSAPANSGQRIAITGYGVMEADKPPEWSQVQTSSNGPYASMSGTTVRYQVDTTGGNSGSSVENLSGNTAIGIHTHGGCSRGNTGSNQGTAAHNTGLRAALNAPRGVCA